MKNLVKMVELLGLMGLRFVVPIFVVSALAKWWDLRRFRRSLHRMRGIPSEPPSSAEG